MQGLFNLLNSLLKMEIRPLYIIIFFTYVNLMLYKLKQQ